MNEKYIVKLTKNKGREQQFVWCDHNIQLKGIYSSQILLFGSTLLLVILKLENVTKTHQKSNKVKIPNSDAYL